MTCPHCDQLRAALNDLGDKLGDLMETANDLALNGRAAGERGGERVPPVNVAILAWHRDAGSVTGRGFYQIVHYDGHRWRHGGGPINGCTMAEMSEPTDWVVADAAMEAGRERMRSSPLQSVITWIPVSERLPEDDREVSIALDVVPNEIRNVCAGYYDAHLWFVADGSPVKFRVTYWAELPPPPASEEE